jgi:hypothetical protein
MLFLSIAAVISPPALTTIGTKSTVLLSSPVGVLRLAAAYSTSRMDLTKETLYDIENDT